MRVAVANPPGILDNGMYIVPFPSRCDWVGKMRSETTYYPYDLAYLTSMLKQAGFEARLFDGHLGAIDAQTYLDMIYDYYPDVIIAECGHLSYPTMTNLMNWLKTRSVTKSILVGPFGSTYPKQAHDDGWNFVVRGEFQHSVLNYLSMGSSNMAGPIDPNTLPLPEDEDVDRIRYWEQSCATRPMVQVYASRGCGMRCEFCTVPIYYGGHEQPNAVMVRKPEHVIHEIEYLANKYPGLPGIMFNDENHSFNMRWLRSLANAIIERGLNNIAYEAMCGYWTFKQEDIELLAKAGYKKIRLGVESLTTESAGGKIGKRVKEDRLRNVLQWCKDNGIRVHLTTMIGVPGSTEAGDVATLEKLIEYKAYKLFDTCQRSICTPNPGTPLYNQCKREGWLVSDDPLDYHWRSAAINYPNYPADRITEVARAFNYYLSLEWGLAND